jgi:hypothetical protein
MKAKKMASFMYYKRWHLLCITKDGIFYVLQKMASFMYYKRWHLLCITKDGIFFPPPSIFCPTTPAQPDTHKDELTQSLLFAFAHFHTVQEN